MHGGKPTATSQDIPVESLELALALVVMLPAVASIDDAWQLCSHAGFATKHHEIEKQSDTWSLVSLTTEYRLCHADTTDLLATTSHSAILRACIERISGILLGASVGSALAARLLQLRAQIPLSGPECMRLLSAVWPVVLKRGNWAVWGAVLDDLLSERDQLSSRDCLMLRRYTAVAARWQGHFAVAEKHLDTALQLAERHTSTEYDLCLLEMAVIKRYRGQLASARTTLASAQQGLVERGAQYDLERYHLEMCHLDIAEGNPEQALNRLESMPSSAVTLALQADAMLLLGDAVAAQESASRAIEYSRGTLLLLGRAYATFGRASLVCGQLMEGQNALMHAILLMVETGDGSGMWRAQAILGQVYAKGGDFEAACLCLENAFQEQGPLDDHIGRLETLKALLDVYADAAEQALDQGKATEASTYAQRMQDYSAKLNSLAPKSR